MEIAAILVMQLRLSNLIDAQYELLLQFAVCFLHKIQNVCLNIFTAVH